MKHLGTIAVLVLFTATSAWAAFGIPSGLGTINSIANATGTVNASTTNTSNSFSIPASTSYPETCETKAEFQLCSASGTTATVVVGVSNPDGNGTCKGAGNPLACCTGNGTSTGAGLCAWAYPIQPWIGVLHSSRNVTLVSGGNSSTGANCQDIVILRQDTIESDGTNIPPTPPLTTYFGNDGVTVPKLAASIQNTGGANSLTFTLDISMVCTPIPVCTTTVPCNP